MQMFDEVLQWCFHAQRWAQIHATKLQPGNMKQPTKLTGKQQHDNGKGIMNKDVHAFPRS